MLSAFFIIATLLFCICVYQSISVLAIHRKLIPIRFLHLYFQLLFSPSVYLIFLRAQKGQMVKLWWELKVLYRFLYTDPFHSKLVFKCASISSFCWLSVLFHVHHCFSLRHLLNALFQHNYHNPHWWKCYHLKILPVLAHIAQMYLGILYCQKLYCFPLFCFLVHNVKLTILISQSNVLSAPDTVANLRKYCSAISPMNTSSSYSPSSSS